MLMWTQRATKNWSFLLWSHIYASTCGLYERTVCLSFQPIPFLLWRWRISLSLFVFTCRQSCNTAHMSPTMIWKPLQRPETINTYSSKEFHLLSHLLHLNMAQGYYYGFKGVLSVRSALVLPSSLDVGKRKFTLFLWRPSCWHDVSLF